MKTLPDDFYNYPSSASMTITTKELRELLLATDGSAIIQGRLMDIKHLHLGAGVYRITVEPRNMRK